MKGVLNRPTTTRSELSWHDRWGLRVSPELPEDVRRMMELSPQPRGRRHSVEYVPIPYAPRDGERTNRQTVTGVLQPWRDRE